MKLCRIGTESLPETCGSGYDRECARQGHQRAGTKTDPAGLQREGLGRASQCQAPRIKSFLSGQLASGRTQELHSELLAEAGRVLAVLAALRHIRNVKLPRYRALGIIAQNIGIWPPPPELEDDGI